MAGTYARRDLIDRIERKIELTQFDKDPRQKGTNKLAGIMEVVLNLDELDNTDNFEDGKPSELYLHITWLLMMIIHISNPTPLSIRNLRVASSFL